MTAPSIKWTVLWDFAPLSLVEIDSESNSDFHIYVFHVTVRVNRDYSLKQPLTG
jgi:hypothetical protein